MGVRSTAWPDASEAEIPPNDAMRSETPRPESDFDWRNAAVQRVLSSPAFAKSNRHSAFLEYVCRLTLDGREDEINELNIGINVFERRENYNASDDTIVRTTARALRGRLKTYYETEGYADNVRIDIPKGTYVPTFILVETKTVQPAFEHPTPVATSTLEAHNPGSFSPNLASFLGTMLLAVAIGAACALLWVAPKRYLPWLRTPSDKLWALVFPGDRSTYIVPADTTLLQYEIKAHRLVPLNEYVGGNFFLHSEADLSGVSESAQRYSKRYTAVTSVQMAEEFGRIPKIYPDRTSVRFARDMQTGDLNESNAILIGAAQNNPWVQLFRNQMNFHLDWMPEENRWGIHNDHPEGTEPREWPWADGPTRTSYSHIALVHNLSGNGYVLIIAGTNMFGSEAGSNFVFDPERMNPLLKKALRSDGSLGDFELLLESNVVGTGTVNTRVAGARLHP